MPRFQRGGVGEEILFFDAERVLRRGGSVRLARADHDMAAVAAQAEFQLLQDRAIKFHGPEAILRGVRPATAANGPWGSFRPPAAPACDRRIPCDRCRAAAPPAARKCRARSRETARADAAAPGPENNPLGGR